jgi:predicted transposase YdaD
MELMTSWERKGRAEGRAEGRVEGRAEGRLEERRVLVKRQLQHRFGVLATTVERRIDRLSAERLDVLAEALLDSTSADDLHRWLAANAGLVAD